MSRKELLRAATGDSGKFARHLTDCKECREAVELLSRFSMAGRAPLPEPPAGWVERAKAVAAGTGVGRAVERLMAQLVFDSWRTPLPVGVRGRGSLGERRLRFEVADVIFDLRAERRKQGWVFVAQFQGAPNQRPGLKIDSRMLLPDASGIYQWVDRRPPRDISVCADEFTLELPRLTWKRLRPTKP